MLVKREAGLAVSRVLAGTIRRTGDDDHDLNLAAALAKSSKDLNEHEYAVASVARALSPFCSGMNVPEAPYVLELPNVLHLATDVTGVAEGGVSSLAPGRGAAPQRRGVRYADRAGPCADRRAGAPGPGALRRAGRLDRRQRGRGVGHRPALWADQRDRSAADPAVRRLRHRRRDPIRRPSWPSRTPSWCRCATRSAVDTSTRAGGRDRPGRRTVPAVRTLTSWPSWSAGRRCSTSPCPPPDGVRCGRRRAGAADRPPGQCSCASSPPAVARPPPWSPVSGRAEQIGRGGRGAPG